ncbi:MAG: hypothetical protein ACE5DO_07470 [Desulfobacterales bacterium]
MDSKNTELEKWKPGVSKRVLLLIAGVMWIGIGIMLDSLAYTWLRVEKPDYALIAAVVGFVSALVIHHLGFLRIVDKNLGRILPMEGKRCVFSFMPWKSYMLIIIMILMGFLIRHLPVPKLYLAVLYSGIGTALILSSVRYLRYLFLIIIN